MVSREEKARLMEAYRYEPIYITAVMLKCAACVLIVGGLMVIAAGIEATGDDIGRLQAQSHEGRAFVEPAHGAAWPETAQDNGAQSSTPRANLVASESCGSTCR